MSDLDDREELDYHRRRLAERRKQKARLGVTADPIITTEIQDIEQEIRRLETKLGLAPAEPLTPDAAPPAGPPRQVGCPPGSVLP